MMDIDITIKGGEELYELHPKKYDKIEDKISEMILDSFPEVGGTSIAKERLGVTPARQKDLRKEITDVKIIVEGGDHLLDVDMNAYYEMVDKIKALVKATFPKVRYCDVGAWGPGYYGGDQIRKAVADVLKEKKFIDELASAVRDIPVGAVGQVADPIVTEGSVHV
ncbi:MAG: hypothetical protein WCE46_02495 [Methanoregula sp.]|uniref:hypothetical protein n=1 Tax=Methanoregula sp. TaxID=2052170 RepID=UPI003C728681